MSQGSGLESQENEAVAYPGEDNTGGDGEPADDGTASQSATSVSDPVPERIPWRRAYGLLVGGIVLEAASFLALGSLPTVPIWSSQVGAALGTASLCGGLYYAGVAHRRQLRRHESVIVRAIERHTAAGFDDLIDELTRQRRIANQLQQDLPEHQEQMAQLEQALADQEKELRGHLQDQIDALQKLKETL